MIILKIIACIFASISIFLLIVIFFGLFDCIFVYLDNNSNKLLKENLGQILTGSITLATFIVIYLDFNIKSKQYEKIQEDVNNQLEINNKMLENLKLERTAKIEEINKNREERKLIKDKKFNEQTKTNAELRKLRNQK